MPFQALDRRTYHVQVGLPCVGDEGFPGPPVQGSGPSGGPYSSGTGALGPAGRARPPYGSQVVMGIGAFIALVALGWLIAMAGGPTLAGASPLGLLALVVVLHVFAIVKRWTGVLVGFWSTFGVAFLVAIVACFALLSAL